MNRPSDRDRLIIDYVAEKLTDDIIEYDPIPDGLTLSRDDIRKSILEALNHCQDWDGFKLGEYLNRRWLCIDAGYIAVLDSATGYQYDKYTDLVYDWVTRYDIQPQFSWGDEVLCRYHYYVDSGSEIRRGTIVWIDRGSARYTVSFWNDPMRALIPCDGRHFFARGTIFNYEDVF